CRRAPRAGPGVVLTIRLREDHDSGDRGERGMGDEVSCALCQRPIQTRERAIFRADGHVAHVACLASTRKPLARLVSEPTPDPICPACTKPIGPTDSVVKDGADLLHIVCFIQYRRPLAGSAPLPAWTLVAEEQHRPTPRTDPGRPSGVHGG